MTVAIVFFIFSVGLSLGYVVGAIMATGKQPTSKKSPMDEPKEIEDLDQWLEAEQREAFASGQTMDSGPADPPAYSADDLAIWRVFRGVVGGA